jgi:hypothetical protein
MFWETSGRHSPRLEILLFPSLSNADFENFKEYLGHSEGRRILLLAVDIRVTRYFRSGGLNCQVAWRSKGSNTWDTLQQVHKAPQ